MARTLFAAGRLTPRAFIRRQRAAATRRRDRSAATGGAGSGSQPGSRATFAVGRRRPGSREVQFVKERPSPFPGPWSLTAVVTGEA